ncbi:MAG: Cell division protein DivIB [Candidatus Magasanikbacteria bacterium GW2011_GWA2_40_10]|uniref:Cell division protein DivIB n=1 Tax=Candidatus Magasanikbacteria bacterium GW2011_GWA2_40_10 TaxID=1619037 RepID=A0A0G0SJ81_9BACT|nr:MAG: Cell division protein DivIB [Candidatus Magasanikbacteria bacterium GW2011_GWA2_40_10]
MKQFRSEYAFKKHKPHVSWQKRFLRFFRKKQYVIASTQDSFHYKTNPFKIHKKPSKIKIKLIIFAALFTVWIIGLAYIPYFKVNKVSYFGLNNMTKNEMDRFVYDNFLNKKSILPLNNYFFINIDKISGSLYKTFAFETVEVTKVFPNQLDIKIKEKISSIIYDNGKKYFLLDSGGTAIKYLKDVEADEIMQTTASSSSVDILSVNTSSTPANTSSVAHTPDYKKTNKLFGNYPIIFDRRGFDIEIKQENILPAEHITTIIAWYKTLSEQGIANPKFFSMDNLNSGVVIDTAEEWKILFQPKNNNDAQISTLKEILLTIKPQQYIDLRFGEKVYWK